MLVGLMEGVKSMEELILGLLGAGQELDVVGHEDIDRPVLLRKRPGFFLHNSGNKFIGEGFTGNILNALRGVAGN